MSWSPDDITTVEEANARFEEGLRQTSEDTGMEADEFWVDIARAIADDITSLSVRREFLRGQGL